MRHFIIITIFLLLSAATLLAGEYLPAFKINGRSFDKVEIATGEKARQKGLMERSYLADNAGMLFRFDAPGLHCFWMSNTLIPLDVIFLDADGTVVSIATMKTEPPRKPGETQAEYEARLPLYCSRGLCSAALEVNAGTAAALGLKTGDTIPELALDKLPKP